MPSANLSIILPTKTFNYVFLLKLAVRDNCMNKIIMKKKEIKPIFTGNKMILHDLHYLFWWMMTFKGT